MKRKIDMPEGGMFELYERYISKKPDIFSLGEYAFMIQKASYAEGIKTADGTQDALNLIREILGQFDFIKMGIFKIEFGHYLSEFQKNVSADMVDTVIDRVKNDKRVSEALCTLSCSLASAELSSRESKKLKSIFDRYSDQIVGWFEFAVKEKAQLVAGELSHECA